MKKFFVTAALLFSAQSFALTPSVVFHSPNSGSNYIVYSDLKTSVQAEATCQSKQGHLVVFQNHAEVVDVKKMLLTVSDLSNANKSVYWFGVSVPDNQTTNPITVTGQAYWLDTSFQLLQGSLGYPQNQVFDFFQDNAGVFSWESGDLILPFICEFEDSAI